MPVSTEQKKQVNANLGTGLPQTNLSPPLILTEQSSEKTVTSPEINARTPVFFKDCKNSTFKLESFCAKIMIQNCHDCTFVINSHVITSSCEVWRCENVKVVFEKAVKSLQLDLSSGVQLEWANGELFQDVVMAGSERVRIGFGDGVSTEGSDFDVDGKSICIGLKELKEKMFPGLDEKIDQFIVRIVKEKVLVERVIRLQNGFPSTEREARQFDQRQEQALAKLAESMGIKVPPKKIVQVGRNDPCICGSVKKYKKCCGVV